MTSLIIRILPVSIGIILVGSHLTHAQVQLGAKAGLAVTNFVGDSDPDFNTKINFTGGFTFRTYFNRNVAVQPELVYTMKGSKTITELDGILSNVSFSIMYIEVPVLLRYSLSPRSSVSPVVAAGPTVAFNVDSRITYGAVNSDLEFTDRDDSIKGVDLGFAAEIGADLQWDLRTISVGARYTYGVSNIIDNPDDPKHNGVFSVTAGIAL
jgi:outer membrane protein W